MVITKFFKIKTEGYTDIIDITKMINSKITESGVERGVVNISCPGSTAGITSIEFEPGAVEDLKNTLEKIAPMNDNYKHNERRHDGNGYAHVRSALLKPFFSAPIIDGRIILGTWQQVVFIDFDNKPRTREIIVQIVGE